MILSLDNHDDVNQQSLKKLEKLVSAGNTVLLNHANWCGHCTVFKTEWNKLTTDKKKHVNFVQIENQALQRMKSENPKLYKRITPKDGMIYFPMIFVFVKNANKPSTKKLYDGTRTAETLRQYLSANGKEEKKTPKPKVVRKPATKAIKGDGEKPVMSLTAQPHYKSLYDLNRELDELINKMSQTA